MLNRNQFLKTIAGAVVATVAGCGDSGEGAGGAGGSVSSSSASGTTASTASSGSSSGSNAASTSGSTGASSGTGQQLTCASPMVTIGTNHPPGSEHIMVVSMADVAAGVDKTYDIMGNALHTHTVTITAADFAALSTSGTIMKTSTTGAMHTHAITVVCAS